MVSRSAPTKSKRRRRPWGGPPSRRSTSRMKFAKSSSARRRRSPASTRSGKKECRNGARATRSSPRSGTATGITRCPTATRGNSAIRLAALMKIPSIFVYTHDSVFLGEDGPTHQSVEQLFSLRLIPNMTLFRPADGAETGMAWAWAVGKAKGPTILVFTRQKLDPIPRGAGFDPHEVWRGAYVLDNYRDGDFTIIATGSEVP